MAYKRSETNSFVAEIDLGKEGLSGSQNLASLRPTQLARAEGITFAPGSIRKEGGSASYTSSSLGGARKIIGGIEFFPSPTAKREVIATASGDILWDTGAGTFATLIKGGWITSDRTHFSAGGAESTGRSKKLFVLNGVNAPMVISGDNVATGDISNPASDWSGTNQPKVMFPIKNRMGAFGNSNDPHRFYLSDPNNHEVYATGATWDTASFSVYPGKSFGISAGATFRQACILWKRPKGIYVLDISNATPSNWQVFELTDAVGCESQFAFDYIVGDDGSKDAIVFVSRDAGIYLIRGAQEFGDFSVVDLTVQDEIRQWLRDNIDFSKIDKTTVQYFHETKDVMVTFVASGSSEANIVLKINVAQTPFRFHISRRDTIVSMWKSEDSNNIVRPMVGDDVGNVRRVDQASFTYSGGGYTMDLQTVPLDFSWIDKRASGRRKIFDFVEFDIKPTGSWPTYVEFVSASVVKQRTSFLNSAGVSELGNFILGQDVLAGAVGAFSITKRIRLLFGGRTVSVRMTQTGDGEEMQISKIRIFGRFGDERTP